MKVSGVWSKAALMAVVLTSCSHGTAPGNADRGPASSDGGLGMQARVSRELTDQDELRIRAMLELRDRKDLNTLLEPAEKAQIMVSSLDQRIKQMRTEGDQDKILGSTGYCRLWFAKDRHAIVEKKMKFAMQNAIEAGPQTEAWFLNQIVDFAHREPAAEAAMIQMLRFYVGEEKEICGAVNCMRSRVERLSGFSVPPLDDSKFSQFVNDHLAEIAKEPKLSKDDLAPGKCREDQPKPDPQPSSEPAPQPSAKPSSQPPVSTGPYDWANRNWVGSVLPDGEFVFTYDDGPHGSYTHQIMSTWENSGFPKPAFFWLNDNIARMSEIVKNARKNGYQIGSHSKRHADLGTLARAQSLGELNAVDREAFAQELRSVNNQNFNSWKNKMLDQEIVQAVHNLRDVLAEVDPGYVMHMFRLPYGSGVRNELIGQRFQALDVEHFFWRVDTLDWQDHNPNSIRDRAVAQMRVVRKGVILFHDIHPQSAAAAPLMVQALKENGWKAVSITKLVPEKRNDR